MTKERGRERKRAILQTQIWQFDKLNGMTKLVQFITKIPNRRSQASLVLLPNCQITKSHSYPLKYLLVLSYLWPNAAKSRKTLKCKSSQNCKLKPGLSLMRRKQRQRTTANNNLKFKSNHNETRLGLNRTRQLLASDGFIAGLLELLCQMAKNFFRSQTVHIQLVLP